jgi:hypothetical protein
VLAVETRFIEAALDAELESTLPPDLPIHRTKAIPHEWTRRLGWGSLARRAYGTLRRAGDALLARGRFDLVFFSTSQFGVLPLGPYWLRRHGVPYVLDLQDEWVSTYYKDHPKIRPPGGRCKYAISHWAARRQECAVVLRAAQIVSVSERYNANLLRRYPELPASRLHTLPFGGAESDFERLRKKPTPHYFFQSGRGVNWVYVGRGGPAMRHATAAFFAATRKALEAGMFRDNELRLHFIGTDYALGSSARSTFAPLAREFGLERIVTESTDRVPHFTALQCLLDADALIVPGSDDPGYTASKIHSYALARRPMLAIFHEESSCVTALRDLGAGTVVPFTSGETREALSERIHDAWFEPHAFARFWPADPDRLRLHSAATMTHRLAKIFQNACCTAAEKS